MADSRSFSGGTVLAMISACCVVPQFSFSAICPPGPASSKVVSATRPATGRPTTFNKGPSARTMTRLDCVHRTMSPPDRHDVAGVHSQAVEISPAPLASEAGHYPTDPSFGVLALSTVAKVRPPSVESEIFTLAALTGRRWYWRHSTSPEKAFRPSLRRRYAERREETARSHRAPSPSCPHPLRRPCPIPRRHPENHGSACH